MPSTLKNGRTQTACSICPLFSLHSWKIIQRQDHVSWRPLGKVLPYNLAGQQKVNARKVEKVMALGSTLGNLQLYVWQYVTIDRAMIRSCSGKTLPPPLLCACIEINEPATDQTDERRPTNGQRKWGRKIDWRLAGGQAN